MTSTTNPQPPDALPRPQSGEVWTDTLGHSWLIGHELPGGRLQATSPQGTVMSFTRSGQFFNDRRPHPADLVRRQEP
jgi:hypothetical protein